MSAARRLLFAPFRAWDRFFFAPVDPRPLAALRIALGALAFLTILGLAPQVDFYYSDAGWFPREQAIAAGGWWTLLHAIGSPWAVRAFAGAALVAAALMTVGWHARAASIATFVALVSFVHRDLLINYGGDSALRVLVFCVALGPSGRAWSVDAWRARLRAAARLDEAGVRDPLRARRMLARPRPIEPWPLRLAQLQVALVYFTSGWAKLHGASWHDGSALALALTNPQISRLDIAHFGAVPGLRAALLAMTAATLAWELLFPVLVIFRRGRALALAGGVLVHGGIWALMRVHWFGHIMVSSYLAYVPGAALRRVALRARRIGRRRVAGRRVRLVYDEACPACRRLARAVALLDVFGAVRFVPLAAARGVGAEEIRARGPLATARGAPAQGFDALAALGRVVPGLAALAIVAALPGGRALGRRAWAAVEEHGRDARA